MEVRAALELPMPAEMKSAARSEKDLQEHSRSLPKELVRMASAPFCGSCGGVLNGDALYCGSCGAPAPQLSGAPPVPPSAIVGTVGGSPVAPAAAVRSEPLTPKPPVPQPPAAQYRPQPVPAGDWVYATFGRRVGAYLIDGIAPLLFVFLSYAALFALVRSASSRGASGGFLVILLLPLAYFVLLWAMAAKGSSPGKAMLGIRVVRERSGAFPGAGLGLGRLLLEGILISVTFYIAGFSPFWDNSGRRRAWWDTAVGTVVLNLSAVQQYRAVVSGRTVGTAAPAPGARAAATPAVWQGNLTPAPSSPPPPPAMDTPPPPPPPPAPAGPADRPEWDLVPVKAESAPVKAPAASWSDRAASQFPPPPPPPPPPPAEPISVASVSTHAAAPVVDDVPWGAAPSAAGGLISAIPGLTPVGNDDEIEHTRMAAARLPSAATTVWYLDFDDHRTMVLDGNLIIGRDPSSTAGETGANLLALGDEGRSVSKTHLRLDAGPAGVCVVDRHSTNGVTVVTAGVSLACVPGEPTLVPAHSTVRFGDRHLVVRQG